MILARVWYTLPPNDGRSLYDRFYSGNYKNDSYPWTAPESLKVRDWNQGLMEIINLYAKEAIERNEYGDILYDYLDGNNVEHKTCEIRANPRRLNLLSKLEYFHEFSSTNPYYLLFGQYSRMEVKFLSDVKYNTIMFKDGLYENEIILIDEPYGK